MVLRLCHPTGILKDSAGPGRSAVAASAGGALVTGLAVQGCPALFQLWTAVRLSGESGRAEGMRWKQKKTEMFRRPRHPQKTLSVWTGGLDQWPWASDCNMLLLSVPWASPVSPRARWAPLPPSKSRPVSWDRPPQPSLQKS